jgi:hypothetical protein
MLILQKENLDCTAPAPEHQPLVAVGRVGVRDRGDVGG